MNSTRVRSAVHCWRLDGVRATLDCSGLSAEVDLARPWLGMRALHIGGQETDGWLLGVDVETAQSSSGDKPWTPLDCYARGADLVATYLEPRGEPFNLQVYWRIEESSSRDAPTIDAIISVQTPLWEAYPRVTAASAIAGDIDASTDAGAIHRAWLERSYVETSRPGDFTLEVRDAHAAPLREAVWRFGDEFMERGVIRRLRLRGAFASRHEDAMTAMRMQKELAEEPPPLTA